MSLLVAGPLAEPAGRIVRELAARGTSVATDPGRLGADDRTVTLVVSDGPFVFDLGGLVRSLGERSFRILILSRLGAHPDAKLASLQRLWRMEEHARGGGAPTLTLRLAPVIGPETPLWRMLRTRPALPGGGSRLVDPVHERDVVETLERALDGRAVWQGWYELAGPERFSWQELSDLAVASGGPRNGAAWEPSLDEIAEHRLAESEPWTSHFGITPTPIAAWMAKHPSGAGGMA